MSGTIIGMGTAFGYQSFSDIGQKPTRSVKTYLYLNNILNATSIFLSPLVGVARAIVTLVFVGIVRQHENNSDVEKALRKMMIGQFIRSGLEIACLGPILGIIDVVVTTHRYEMLCFKKA